MVIICVFKKIVYFGDEMIIILVSVFIMNEYYEYEVILFVLDEIDVKFYLVFKKENDMFWDFIMIFCYCVLEVVEDVMKMNLRIKIYMSIK